MKKKKPNISLLAVSEIDRCGFFLALQKGVNELLCPFKKEKPKPLLPMTEEKGIVSIIICTTGESKVLQESIKSAMSQDYDKFEVLVVLNSEKEISLPKGAKLIREPRKGLSHARNRGAEAAKGDIMIFIDDDAVADKQMCKRLAAAFKSHPKAGVIGGQIFLKLPQPVPDVVLQGKESLWSEYRVPFKKYRKVKGQYEFPYGACFGIRKTSFLAAGGFPVDFGRVGHNYAGGEETALCFKVQKLGWEIGVEPNAYVEHCVDVSRFSREHVKETIRAGILTTYRLSNEGYAPWQWDRRYIKERLRLADLEIKRLEKRAGELEVYYKKCERETFAELLLNMEDIC